MCVCVCVCVCVCIYVCVCVYICVCVCVCVSVCIHANTHTHTTHETLHANSITSLLTSPTDTAPPASLCMCVYTHTQRERGRQRLKHSHRHTHRHRTHTQTDKETQRHRDTEPQRHRGTETHLLAVLTNRHNAASLASVIIHDLVDCHKFSNVSLMVNSYSKCNRNLTFENFHQACEAYTCPHKRLQDEQTPAAAHLHNTSGHSGLYDMISCVCVCVYT
jgi:CCR4-NOT transcriptional regulation complex NOT5 subunit